MNETTRQLQDWAINKIKTEYPDDVALLIAVDGMSENGDGHGECFSYFVPCSERGYELGQTFILDGIGHDLYSRDWARCERTANLEEGQAFCISQARVVYSRTQEDEARFLALQLRLQDNLQDKVLVYRKALERLGSAMELERTMTYEERFYMAYLGLGYIAHYLTQGVLYLNGRCESGDSAYEQAQGLKQLPDGFCEYLKAMHGIKTAQECRSLAHLLISATRKFIEGYRPPQGFTIYEGFNGLADWYQEVSLTFRRLRYYSDVSDVVNALHDSMYIQMELNIIAAEFRLREMDLLGSWNPDDLSEIAAKANEFERYIVEEIMAHDVKLCSYDTIEQFLAEN